MCNKMSTSVVYSKSSPMTQKSSNVQLFPTTINSAAKMLKYQHIAPAPLNAGGGDLINTRKYTPRATNAPYNVDQTQSVQRRNARERNRVKQVNNSFAKLRQHIPQTIITDLTKGGGRGPHKKISKVDTLRIAVEYIRRLQDLVDDLNGGPVNGSSSNHIMHHDTLSNISFCTSSSSSSMADSPPPPSTLPPTTVNAFHYTPLSSSSTSSPPLPSYQQQFTNIVGGATTSSVLLTPVSLHAYNQMDGAASPTSSFNSSMSFDSGTYEPTSSRSNNQQQSSSSASNEHLNAHLQLKFEPYDNFQLHEEDCQPDDEEILDYISLWQEQQ